MEIHTYADLQVYLESFIKPFAAIRSGDDVVTPLDRMCFFLEQLGNPHQKFRSIVVTGTSGKGSTAYLLSHVLQQGGYRVGLTISPHLQKINERLQINGASIDDTALIGLLREIQPVVEKMKETRFGAPSYYELLAVCAFLYFSRNQLDLVIVEVGMEGKYEASNLLSPLGVILGNISLDHTAILGDTVEKIAEEAVYAINGAVSHGFVISAVEQPSVLAIVEKRCLHMQMQLFLLQRDFSFLLKSFTLQGCVFDFYFGEYSLTGVRLSLLGDYQATNASLVLAGISLLRSHGFMISEEAIRRAFETAFFSGRFEIIPYLFQEHIYTIILDGAHNEAKMDSFIHSLAVLYPKRKKVFVLSFKKDKSVKQLLKKVLSQADIVIVTEFSSSTDMAKNVTYSSSELADIIRQLSSHLSVFVEPTSQEA